ncbi:MAG TPA: zf-HC2 domain-containing protein [Acidimicrobiia bacterium]|nr:zf-HC2 domain-containing protein [Acidimicrobiia bacterium]
MTWHIDDQMLALYMDGRMSEVPAFSLEAHVLACADCRRRLTDRVDSQRGEQIWQGLLDSVSQAERRPGERLLSGLGVPAHVARLLVLTPSVGLAWVLSVMAAVAFAVLASQGSGGPLPFLVLAPLLPVLGVAVSFGRRIDPLYEIGIASPLGGFRLMLVRATAVLTTSIVVATVAALGLPEVGFSAVWLLPALFLTVLTLILSTVIETSSAALFASAIWIGGVITFEVIASDPYIAFGTDAQLVFAVLAVLLAAALIGRRGSFEVI